MFLCYDKKKAGKKMRDKEMADKEMMDKTMWRNIIGLRMERQFLTRLANEADYEELYRDTQPGQNVYWHGFGQPPVISFRAAFDDMEFNRVRQEEHKLAKGRFQGGNLGWLDVRDMELFACMCQKPLERPTFVQAEILELIRRQGPMNIQQIKEETGYLVKQITPILHRLQEAFLIYEDQYDGEWDRGWYTFEEMFPEVDLGKYTRKEALCIVLQRFAKRMVWFDVKMARDFYKLPIKDIKIAAEELAELGIFVKEAGGYLLQADARLLDTQRFEVPGNLFIMHRNDILVKAFEGELKDRYYKKEYETLEYILIDGEIHGVVHGKFKYGPYIIEDVVVDEQYTERKIEIIAAVEKANPGSTVLRFMGEKIEVL